MRAAVENDLGVDVHEEAALALHAERLRAPARADAAEEAASARAAKRLRQSSVRRKAARAFAVQLLLELLAQQLIDLRPSRGRARSISVSPSSAASRRFCSSVQVGACPARNSSAAFARDARQRADQALAFLHLLLHQLEQSLEGQMRRHRGEIAPSCSSASASAGVCATPDVHDRLPARRLCRRSRSPRNTPCSG